MTNPPPLRVLVAGVLALACVLAAYVVLAVNGLDTGSLFAGVLALLAAVGLAGHQQAITQAQNTEIGAIKHQTNGQLTERIRTQTRAAVRDVLREVGYAIPDDNTTADRQLIADMIDPDHVNG